MNVRQAHQSARNLHILRFVGGTKKAFRSAIIFVRASIAMKQERLMWRILLCCLSFAICSCSSELHLSDHEAIEIIRRAHPAERVNGLVVLPDSPEALRTASDLIAQGLLSEVGALANFAAAAGVTDDQKPTVSRNAYWQKLEFRCPLFTRTVTEVNEVLVDRQNETAIVTYTTSLEPLQPYHTALCVKNRPLQPVQPPQTKQTQQIMLKHFDKGWRILGE